MPEEAPSQPQEQVDPSLIWKMAMKFLPGRDLGHPMNADDAEVPTPRAQPQERAAVWVADPDETAKQESIQKSKAAMAQRFQESYFPRTAGAISMDERFKSSDDRYWSEGAPRRKWIDNIIKSEGKVGWDEKGQVWRKHHVGKAGYKKGFEANPTTGYGRYLDTPEKIAQWDKVFGKEGMPERYAQLQASQDLTRKEKDAERIFNRTAKRLKLDFRWEDIESDDIKGLIVDRFYVGIHNAPVNKGFQTLVQGVADNDWGKIIVGAQQPGGKRGQEARSKKRRTAFVPAEELGKYRPTTLGYDEPWTKEAHTRTVVVPKGWNLTQMAKKFGVTKQQIIGWNQGKQKMDKNGAQYGRKYMQAGDKIRLMIPAWKD